MALELTYKRFMDFASTAYKRSMARELNKMGELSVWSDKESPGTAAGTKRRMA
jgi:hypothetical protein